MAFRTDRPRFQGPRSWFARAARLRLPGKRAALAAASAALVALASGCGAVPSNGVSDMALPGGADLGSHPYEVKAQFRDVLDLVPNSGVRVNDVPVGRVESVQLAPGTWLAQVTMKVNGDVRLPANTIAQLRQSSLLGEKFIELAPPPSSDPPWGRLANGATIGLDRTNRNPEVEEVLGAMSLLLNGGGVGQLQDITRELNATMGGREGDVRGLLSNLNKTVSSLDAQRDDIVRAIDGLNRLSAQLNAQRGNIDVALRDLGPGLQVINDERSKFVTMLQSLDRLSGVATNVINQSKDDTVHDLNALAPTLQQLAASGSDLPKAFEVLLTYPFPDAAVNGIKGDYTNLYAKVNLNLTDIVDNLSRSPQSPLTPPGAPPLPLVPPPSSSAPTSPPPSSSAPSTPPPQNNGGLLGSLFGGS